MPWQQLTIESNRERAEALGNALEETGAVAVSLEGADAEALFETDWHDTTPVWKQTRVVALYDADADVPAALAAAAALLGLPESPPYRLDTVEDQDWARVWMDRWRPLHFGGDLWVVPSWLAPPEPDATNLVLDPGMAFGTGTHATTALCLEWLAQHPPYGREVIDVGCGSGILAIAALLLGAEQALGTDTDPQALIVSRENAERNAVADRLALCLPEEMAEGASADLVLANILAGPLVALAPRLAQWVRPGGRLILSGLLSHQAAEVEAAYREDFDLERQERDGWLLLAGRRRD